MQLTFYGVRGSIPVPDTDMIKFGGNTSCVYIKLSDGKNLVLDAGTGIRLLGKRLLSSSDPIHILVSHSHWDHVIGYPFFQPIYQEGRDIFIYQSRSGGHEQLCSLLEQMDGAHFPISADQLPSRTRCFLDDVEGELKRQGFDIRRKTLNHPGHGYAYRIHDNGASCVYATDNELPLPEDPKSNYQEWVEFCRGADVLIHDAQYLEDEMFNKRGWGHSSVSRVWQLALDAGVKKLVLFHYDPDRTDLEVEQIQNETRAFFHKMNGDIKSVCAYEGLVLDIVAQQQYDKVDAKIAQAC